MKRKAVLLTTRGDHAEMEELVFALGSELVATFHQRRGAPDPQLFLGRGRMEEIRAQLGAMGVDLVVVNGQLRPGQIFNLQQFLGRRDAHGEVEPVEVYDRTRLILEIFRERARSPEARLQVELAQLHYDMPLVKEAIQLQRRGERQAAQFGGGEYEVDQLYLTMKKRMARIRRDLEKMRLERGVRRKHRRRGGFHLVSLAGYTNAGKSSLLKALAHEPTLVEDRYFSTLSTKTARARSDRREILVTDTVGFIEGLPPWLVDAFHSTLEEVALADVILLVVDASDPIHEMARRLRSSLRVLWEFDGGVVAAPRGVSGSGAAARAAIAAAGEPVHDDADAGRGPRASADAALHAEDDAGGGDAARRQAGSARFPVRRGLAPILVALNKCDRLAPGELDAKRAALEAEGLLVPGASVAVSAKSGDGLQELYERLYELIPDYDEYEVALPPRPESEALVAWLHEHADVLDLTRGQETHVHFEAKRSLRAELGERLERCGATPLMEALRGGAAHAARPDRPAPLDAGRGAPLSGPDVAERV